MTQKAIKTELLLLDRGGERGGGRKDFTGKEGGAGRGGSNRRSARTRIRFFFFFKTAAIPLVEANVFCADAAACARDSLTVMCVCMPVCRHAGNRLPMQIRCE